MWESTIHTKILPTSFDERDVVPIDEYFDEDEIDNE